MMTINVGGFKYQTIESTLCNAPFLDGLLRNSGEMGEERVGLAMKRCEDADGNLFLDRNGEAFKDILEFLRTRQPVLPSVSVSTLKVEADFYGITGFQVIEQPAEQKKIYMPADRVQHVRLEAVDKERFHQKTRFYFNEEELPAHILEFTHKGKRGCGGCLYQQDLTKLGFKKVHVASSKVTAGDDEDDETYCFESAWRIAWVDVSRFDIDKRMWDHVEFVVPGRVAKVVAYE